MPQVFDAGEKESKAHLRLFSSFLLFWSVKKTVTAQTLSPPWHRREGSRFRGLGLAFPGTAPVCAGANLSALSCAPAQDSAGLCRLLLGGKGALCFLEGAKPAVATWLGCSDRWHWVLLGLCHEKWFWAAGTGRWVPPTAAVAVGSPGESPAQPSLCHPSPGNCCPAAGEAFLEHPRLAQGSCSMLRGAGVPWLSLCPANHRESTWVGVCLVK